MGKQFGSRVGEQTEGGEALPTIGTMHGEELAEQCNGLPAAVAATCPWYALYTRSHCEQLVYEQLATKGFHLLLPTIQVWSQRAGVKHRIAVPMFPGYLFLHSLVDSAIYLEVRQASNSNFGFVRDSRLPIDTYLVKVGLPVEPRRQR